MRRITFLHTADIHLGAPVRGLSALDDEWAARMQSVTAETYDRIIRVALNRKVDFVVVAGDLFDTSRVSYGDYARMFDGLRKLDAAGIPAFLVTGNHDPFTSWARDVEALPASTYLLGVRGPAFRLFEKDGEPLCIIGGRSYYNQTWPRDEDIAEGLTRAAAERALVDSHPNAADAPFAVGVLHTGLDIDHIKSPTSVDGLLESGFDYWACGHLHLRHVIPSADNPRIVFPGCAQGRDIKESGERGCYYVELQEGRVPAIEFIPTASVVLQTLEVDASSPRTLTDLERHIQSELFRENGKARCEEMVVHVRLVGATDLHEYLSQPDVLESMRKHLNGAYPSFFCDKLENDTRPLRDRVSHQGEGVFSSFVESMAADQRRNDEQMIHYIQSEFVKRGIAVPDWLSHKVGRLGDAAELLVLDLLEERSE